MKAYEMIEQDIAQMRDYIDDIEASIGQKEASLVSLKLELVESKEALAQMLVVLDSLGEQK